MIVAKQDLDSYVAMRLLTFTPQVQFNFLKLTNEQKDCVGDY